jgi:hypothetical protein
MHGSHSLKAMITYCGTVSNPLWQSLPQLFYCTGFSVCLEYVESTDELAGTWKGAIMVWFGLLLRTCSEGQYITVDSRTWRRRGTKRIAVWFWTAERRYVCPWANAALSLVVCSRHGSLQMTEKKKVYSFLRIEALWDSELWKPQIPQFRLSFPLPPLYVTLPLPPPHTLGLPSLPYSTSHKYSAFIHICLLTISIVNLYLSIVSAVFLVHQICFFARRTRIPSIGAFPFPPPWQKLTLIYDVDNYCMSDYACMYLCVSNLNLSFKKTDFVRLEGSRGCQTERTSQYDCYSRHCASLVYKLSGRLPFSLA